MESAFQAVFIYSHKILAQKTGTLRLRRIEDYEDRLEGKPDRRSFSVSGRQLIGKSAGFKEKWRKGYGGAEIDSRPPDLRECGVMGSTHASGA